jgi:hypothetical protein
LEGKSKMNRRNFIQVGCLGSIGLSLADYLKLQAEDGIAPNARAQSVIYIYLPGGFAAQETFDPKPLAPVEYKGPLSAINTNVPGSQFSQYLEQTAKIADKITVIRSMTHGETAHERGTNNMFTGWRPSPALQYPSLGSVVSHELGVRNNLPPYVSVPSVANEFAGAGYLSHSYSSFSLGSNPEDKNFQVRDLKLPDGVDVERFAKRKKLLEVVNNSDFVRTNKYSDSLIAVDQFYENAFSMLNSPESTAAFDLTKEDDKMKERYGKNAAGMRMLLSRRLVEAGSRFITMTYGGWDMHQNIATGIQNSLPAFDKAFAALISDLDERGLLDSTLVLVGSEFGRTPKINPDAGRDHWPRVYSTVMAGGGIARGLSYGTSDATSNEPQDNPVSPESWAATIYYLLGIDYGKALMAPGDRPVKIIDNGHKHIEGILA